MSQEKIEDYLILLSSQDWRKYVKIAMHIAKSKAGQVLCKCPKTEKVLAEINPDLIEFPNLSNNFNPQTIFLNYKGFSYINFEIATKYEELKFYLLIQVDQKTISKEDIKILKLGVEQIKNTLEGLSKNQNLEATNTELTEQRDEVNQILESFGHMTLVLDEKAKMLQIFGKRDLILDSSAIMEGKSVYDYQELSHIHQELKNKIEKHKHDFQVFSINYTLNNNGNREWFKAKIKPYLDKNNKVHFLTFILNITDQVLTNKAIKETNNLLTETGKLAKVGAWKLDIQNKKIFLSSVTKKILEINVNELKVYNALAFFGGQNSKNKIYKLIRNTLLKKESHTAEFRITTNSKKSIWVNIKVNATFKDGTLNELYGSIQDITGFKDIENQLITEQNRLSYIIEGSDLGAWEWNSITDIAYHNDKWAKILGYEPEEILPINAEKWEKLIHPDDLNKYNSEMAKHLRGETKYYQSEIRLKAKNGDYKWILDRGKVISYDRNGIPEKVYGTHRDITKEKLTEVKLKDNLKRFKTIFDFSPVGMVLVDYYSGNFIEVNNTTLKLTGYEKDEFLKLNLWNLAKDKTEEDHIKLKTLATEGNFMPYEKEIVKKDGKAFIGLLQGKLFESTEGKKRVLSIITDITKDKKIALELRQKTLQAKRANRAKTEFLANMSHEMKTPLNGIIGFSDLITNSNLNETQRMYMHTIKSSAQTLKGLISDVLDFSKIEAGKLALDITAVSIEQLVREVVHVVQHLAFEKGLLFILDIPLQLPEIIYIDQLKTKQVLINLINNALKFTDEGFVKLSLETKKINEKSLNLCLRVTDSGAGIKKENIHKILDAFTQEDSSINRQKGGTGLGLAISNKFIQLMGSEIIIESELNKGSQFGFKVCVEHNNKTTNQLSIKKELNFIDYNLNPYLLEILKKQLPNFKLENKKENITKEN
ncbi:MAG: PAS domain S-box protein, partial [Flavobacteriaceae bacterium]|nr:PAS domain S-box protein [Flavobacteriaceae bacterium]